MPDANAPREAQAAAGKALPPALAAKLPGVVGQAQGGAHVKGAKNRFNGHHVRREITEERADEVMNVAQRGC